MRYCKLRRLDGCQLDALHNPRDVDQTNFELVHPILRVVTKDDLGWVAAQRSLLNLGSIEAGLEKLNQYLLAVDIGELRKALSFVARVLLEVYLPVDAGQYFLVFDLLVHRELGHLFAH